MSEQRELTEAEWLSCNDPVKMMAFLQGRVTDRKWRLFAAGCCRSFQGALAHPAFTQAIETAEQFADKLTSKAALKPARQAVNAARHELQQLQPECNPRWVAYWLAEVATSENAFAGILHEIQRLMSGGLMRPESQPGAYSLLRCITGNPFCGVAVDAGCRTPVVEALAQAAYEQRSFPAGALDSARLAVLADALEDAGCTDPDILNHLRHPGPHVRGCHVIDALLRKK